MYDNDLIRAILGQIYEAAGRIKRRFLLCNGRMIFWPTMTDSTVWMPSA